MFDVPLTKTPNKPLGGFAEYLRADTIGDGETGRLQVHPIKSEGDKPLKTACGWSVRLAYGSSVVQEIDVGSGMSITISARLYLYIRRAEEKIFQIGLVYVPEEGEPEVVRRFEPCSAWQCKRQGNLRKVETHRWKVAFWTNGPDGFQEHETEFDQTGAETTVDA